MYDLMDKKSLMNFKNTIIVQFIQSSRIFDPFNGHSVRWKVSGSQKQKNVYLTEKIV